MSDVLCVTSRRLCGEAFLTRIQRIAEARPAAIILREKDLPEEEYKALARQVIAVCREQGVPCILHSFVDTAMDLGADAIHLPLPILRGMTDGEKRRFSVLGASCHSVEEARAAEKLGCAYITAGHIFATDCKAGLPGRGLDFLGQVCQAVGIPVYAIGGIGPENIAAVREAGAAGACVMSGLMGCADPAQYLQQFQQAGEKHEF